MKSDFNATGRRVVVRVPENLGESETGVISGDKERPDRGIIVAIGHEVQDPAVAVGKLAVFSKFGGQAYSEGKVDYILLDIGELYITKDV